MWDLRLRGTLTRMTAALQQDRDPGLYGPDSVTWRVHADPAMALAGLRALLLQAVHPVAMHGVFTNSDFRADPWGRLFRTAEYVAVTAYGTTREAERAEARARDARQQLAQAEARQEDVLREADRLDPEVDTRREGYRPGELG